MVNLFVVHNDPETAAKLQADKHVHKMAVECMQILSTALRFHLGDAECDALGLMATAYSAHPCALWARSSATSLAWVASHALALHEEFEVRYGKRLKSHDMAVVAAARALDLAKHSLTLPAFTTREAMRAAFEAHCTSWGDDCKTERGRATARAKRDAYMRESMAKLRPWPAGSELDGVAIAAFGVASDDDATQHMNDITADLDIVESYRRYYAAKLHRGVPKPKARDDPPDVELRVPYAYGGEFVVPPRFAVVMRHVRPMLQGHACVQWRGIAKGNKSKLVTKLPRKHVARAKVVQFADEIPCFHEY